MRGVPKGPRDIFPKVCITCPPRNVLILPRVEERGCIPGVGKDQELVSRSFKGKGDVGVDQGCEAMSVAGGSAADGGSEAEVQICSEDAVASSTIS